VSKPKFITFTGVDDFTSIPAMLALSAQYPIEWAILFSPKLQGTGRFPSLEFVKDLTMNHSDSLRLAAHLCGGYSKHVIECNRTSMDEPLSTYFRRVQINTYDHSIHPGMIQAWADDLRVTPILQCRGDFPVNSEVSWLFDTSGGRGKTPESWPVPKNDGFYGYSGGIGPENVAALVEHFGSLTSNYWIDMESSLRDDQGRFSVERCRQVCEAVYGAPKV
jgi:hypothetical protein